MVKIPKDKLEDKVSEKRILTDIEKLQFFGFLREQYAEKGITFQHNTPKSFYGEGVDVIVGKEKIGHLILEFYKDPNKGFASVRYVGSLPEIIEGEVLLTWVNPEYNQQMSELYTKAQGHEEIPFP